MRDGVASDNGSDNNNGGGGNNSYNNDKIITEFYSFKLLDYLRADATAHVPITKSELLYKYVLCL